MGKRLERFCEVGIVDEANGFGLDFVEKAQSGFWSATVCNAHHFASWIENHQVETTTMPCTYAYLQSADQVNVTVGGSQLAASCL